MGTRADFYLGRGAGAIWLGSIAWDGYPSGIPNAVKEARTAENWDRAVAEFLSTREDATFPAAGWPWPWPDSRTTDYAYAWAGGPDGGRVYASHFGLPWFVATEEEPEFEDDAGTVVFPQMDSARMAPPGSLRSGILLVSAQGLVAPDASK